MGESPIGESPMGESNMGDSPMGDPGAVDREFFNIETLPELSQGLPELCQSLPELTQTSTASQCRRSYRSMFF